ncbi:MAG: M56 family metallopeptidase, partial [Sphingomicrobium sp.]
MIDWLVGTFYASSALMALVLALREPVRRWFGTHVVYALWLLPAARMVLPSLPRTVERTAPSAESGVLSLTPSIATAPVGMVPNGLIDQLGGWTDIFIAFWLSGAVGMLVFGLFRYMGQRRAILGSAVALARIGSIRLLRSEKVRGPMAFGIFDRVIVVPFDFDDRFSECQRRLALAHELAHHRSFDLPANLIAFVLLCLQW